MLCARHLLPVLLLGALFVSKKTYAESEVFDGRTFLEYPADPRLDLGDTATIELSFRLKKLDNVPHPLPSWLIAHGDGEQTSFAIQLDSNWNELVVFSERGKGRPFSHVKIGQFDERETREDEAQPDGRWHYVALVFEAGKVSAFINGKPRGVVGDFEMSHETTSRMPLHVGYYRSSEKWVGKKGASLNGEIRTLRVWDTALSNEEIQAIADYRRAPPSEFPAMDHLVGYADMSGSFIYNRNPISFVTAGVAPASSRALAFYAKAREGQSRISRLYVQSDQGGIRNLAVMSRDPMPIPLVHPIAMVGRDPQASRKTAILTRKNGDENTMRGAIDQLNRYRPIGEFQFMDIRSDERITAIYGTHDGTHIKTLGVRTTQGLRDWERADKVPAIRGPELFFVRIPPGATFEGIVGQLSDQGLHEIGLAYSFQTEVQDRMIQRFTTGRWIVDQTNLTSATSLDFARPFEEPQRDDELAFANGHHDLENSTVLPHGTYTSFDCWRLIHQTGTASLLLCRDSEAQTYGIRFDPVPGSLNRYQSPDGAGDSRYLTLAVDGKASVVYQYKNDFVRFLRPAPYELGERQEKLPWGATFSLNERPTQVGANFTGYNVSTMHPRDFQFDSGSSRLLFDYPDEHQRQYQPTDGKIIVPHGLFYRPDNEGFESMRVETISNAAEHAASHKTNIGFKVGLEIPYLHFGGSASYRRETESMAKNREQHKSEWTIARSTETRYALVLDKSRVQLDDYFRDRVLELRNRHLAGYDLVKEGDYSRFVDEFGTHYPYAATYGGMTYLQSEYTETSRQASQSSTSSRSVEGHVSFFASSGGDGTWGGSKSNENESSGSSKSDMFRTYGGSLSRGEGWSLPKGEEIPILMDLRPIYELFSPLFFEDPIVWMQLRVGVQRSLRQKSSDNRQANDHLYRNNRSDDYAFPSGFVDATGERSKFSVRTEGGRVVMRSDWAFDEIHLRSLNRMPVGMSFDGIKEGSALPPNEWYIVERESWNAGALIYPQLVPPGPRLVHFTDGQLTFHSPAAAVVCNRDEWSGRLESYEGGFQIPKEHWANLGITNEDESLFSISVERGKLVFSPNGGFANLTIAFDNGLGFVAETGRLKNWDFNAAGIPVGEIKASFGARREYVELKFATTKQPVVIRCTKPTRSGPVYY